MVLSKSRLPLLVWVDDSHQRSDHKSRNLTSELKPCPDARSNWTSAEKGFRFGAPTPMINLWCQPWDWFDCTGSLRAAAGVFGYLQSRSVSSSWTLLHGGLGQLWDASCRYDHHLPSSQDSLRSVLELRQSCIFPLLACLCKNESWGVVFQIPLSGEFTQWLSQHYRRLLVGGGNIDFFRTDPCPP